MMGISGLPDMFPLPHNSVCLRQARHNFDVHLGMAWRKNETHIRPRTRRSIRTKSSSRYIPAQPTVKNMMDAHIRTTV